MVNETVRKNRRISWMLWMLWMLWKSDKSSCESYRAFVEARAGCSSKVQIADDEGRGE